MAVAVLCGLIMLWAVALSKSEPSPTRLQTMTSVRMTIDDIIIDVITRHRNGMDDRLWIVVGADKQRVS
jgi:hypothetical protein